MTAEYVRWFYGVPAKRGSRILFEGKPGTIVAFDQQYLKVRMDGEKKPIRLHPTWEVEYL